MVWTWDENDSGDKWDSKEEVSEEVSSIVFMWK